METRSPGSPRKIFYDSSPNQTKPNFADLNGDGNLDLVYGETNGLLISFKGTARQGTSHFSDQGEILRDENGKLLKVNYHSSPHLIDWDGDLDLDIICGSGKGGIFYAENIGNTKVAKWKSFTEWVPEIAIDHTRKRHIIQNGRQKLQPSGSKTIYVTDYNHDGKLDLLVGEETIIDTPLDGVSDEEYTEKEAQYQAMQDDESATAPLKNSYFTDPKSRQKLNQAMDAKREKETAFSDSFKTSETTGFVWLYLQD